MKINKNAIMSDADWALYEAQPTPELPPPSPKKPRPLRWRRIYTVQNPCGCLVTRFEPYAGKARQAPCPHEEQE